MNKKIKNNEHEFAFYYPATSGSFAQAAHEHKVYELTDKPLCHRIETIVRLHEGESFILFDQTHHTHCTIVKINRRITISPETLIANVVLSPRITFLLPILKREAFEDAIYALTALGVNEIQPIITTKSYRHVSSDKDNERFERIMYAAAEQSKNFAFPTFEKPLPFDQLQRIINRKNNVSLFFDPEGSSTHEVFGSLKNYSQITLMIGPEGDCTAEEKNILKQLSFTFCKLTPTILRAEQAAALAAGLVRSFM